MRQSHPAPNSRGGGDGVGASAGEAGLGEGLSGGRENCRACRLGAAGWSGRNLSGGDFHCLTNQIVNNYRQLLGCQSENVACEIWAIGVFGITSKLRQKRGKVGFEYSHGFGTA